MAFRHSKRSRLYLAEHDLSAVTTSLEGLPGPRNTYDATTFADGGMKRHPGLEEATPTIEMLFSDNDPDGGDVAMSALKAAGASGQVLSYVDDDGVIEKVVYSGGNVLYAAHEKQTRVGSILTSSGDLDMNGVVDRGKSLGPKQTAAIVATTNGAEVDDGGPTSLGGVLTVHVFTFTATGGNAQWICNLQMDTATGFASATNAVAATFTAVGAQRVTFTGTFEQFIRIQFQLDATSGSLIAFASFVRN